MFHRSPAAGNRHSVRCHLLWEGSWTSGTITVPGASRYTVFEVVFANPDRNLWPALCVATPGSELGFSIYPQFSGVVNGSVMRATVSAYIYVEADTMLLRSLTSIFVQGGGSGNPLAGVSSTQNSRISHVYGIE